MKLALLALPIAAICLSTPALADKTKPSHLMPGHLAQADHSMDRTSPILLAQAGADMADGEIKRISKGSKKLTVKHGEIKSLEMPPMTMAFSVSDEKMLDMVKKGDKIKFKVETINGQMVITEIAPQ